MSDTYFHIGILVHDLDAAIEHYAAMLGLGFNPPTPLHFHRLLDPEPHEAETLVTYSKDGPPYYELVRASGDGVFAPRRVGGVHHVGLWEPDIEARFRELEGRGVRFDARILTAAGTHFAFMTNPEDTGLRFEYVDARARRAIEGWIATGEVAGDFRV